ncbi:preprotein translocase subunit YajC [Salinisphaera japonica]|uniref:Sec translocon accessory complex subunit YajC n=1 Tax=Salinisphaera japonica YTM-1 TaxID=1209778 RepID=A0A423PET4_9GAMM|nr:preprotein translocase subunit YajC [Salinisphaera japonica]ROO24094.1 preprotein translocase subunit YajC [Salinisphaera japonica YTM-1]|tara:strand:- start:402 stop:731 length:330 start_codon:yes stop_codon:yes gene_type:complete
MDFLISNAYAQGGGGQGGSIIPTVLMVAVFFVFMYFMIIRPQMKRQKEHKKLLESLDKGSEIVTAGGLAGRIREVGENFLVVEIAQGTEVRVQKSSVTSVVPKGTLDAL